MWKKSYFFDYVTLFCSIYPLHEAEVGVWLLAFTWRKINMILTDPIENPKKTAANT